MALSRAARLRGEGRRNGRLCFPSAEGIETHLWDDTAGRYRTAVSVSGAPTADADAPDAFAQLYPLLCGLPEAEGERGQALYAAFRADGLDDWFAQTAGADTGAALGLAVLKAGDAESARAFIAALRDRYAAAGYPYRSPRPTPDRLF